jgi:hypothetical protein
VTWYAPIIIPKRRSPYRCDVTVHNARGIVVEGRKYPSLSAAARSYGCSISKIYRLIGENWRSP